MFHVDFSVLMKLFESPPIVMFISMVAVACSGVIKENHIISKNKKRRWKLFSNISKDMPDVINALSVELHSQPVIRTMFGILTQQNYEIFYGDCSHSILSCDINKYKFYIRDQLVALEQNGFIKVDKTKTLHEIILSEEFVRFLQEKKH